MLISRSWMALVGLGAIAAGCEQSPTTLGPDIVRYRIQEVTPDWRGGGWTEPPMPRYEFPPITRPVTPPRTATGGWGRHYPWRGPGERPAWYGVHAHVANSYVLIGQYYYPYYFEDGQIYPVYSMPHTLSGGTIKRRYGPLPAFGPYVVAPASARLFRVTR